MKSERRKQGGLKKRRLIQLGPKEKLRKPDPKVRKILRKKARDYNSDEEEVKIEARVPREGFADRVKSGNLVRQVRRVDDDDKLGSDGEPEEEEEETMEPGITMFSEGCRAFRIAFKSIMKSSGQHIDSSLGPMLSAKKKLVTEKLADENAEMKIGKETKKEKILTREKGHVKPSNVLDSHEKFLIGVATKGVVKLFNAVNKARQAQKGLNPSRSKDAKVINARRKEVFSELAKSATVTAKNRAVCDVEQPSWAPLRDNYMLTSSKLKDWDKMPVKTVLSQAQVV